MERGGVCFEEAAGVRGVVSGCPLQIHSRGPGGGLVNALEGRGGARALRWVWFLVSMLRPARDSLIVRGLPGWVQGSLAVLVLRGEPPGAAVDARGHAEVGAGWAGLMRQEVGGGTWRS